MPDPKVEEAVTVALEAIHDAAPGLLTLTQVAEKIASHADVTTGTARKRLRTAIEAGDLLELKPWSRRFVIELPGEEDAGVGPFYIAQEVISRTGVNRGHRRVITTDNSKMRPSSYGPGNTTYVVDPEQAREYVQQLADEKKAEEEKERQAEKKAEEAERKEIARRFPGLNRTLRKVMFVGRNVHVGIGKTELLECDTRLSRRGSEAEDISERRLHLDVRAWGDENVAILQSILEIGIAAHIQTQEAIYCEHCSRRILHTTHRHSEFWWHVDTSNASCGKGRDTKAEPTTPNVPRETSTN